MSQEKRKTHLFLSRSFIVAVAVGATTYLKPAVESLIRTKQLDDESAIAIVSFISVVGYNAWLRQATDYEGESYTPKGIPGKNKEDIE